MRAHTVFPLLATLAMFGCNRGTDASKGTEPVIAPALIMLAGMMVWTGEFDEGERWLRRAEPALQADTGPDLRLHAHMASALLYAGRGRHSEALREFSEAEHLRSQME